MEQGDATTKRRLKAFAEKERSPYCFTDGDRFAWTFGLDEDHSRGQLNSLIIMIVRARLEILSKIIFYRYFVC